MVSQGRWFGRGTKAAIGAVVALVLPLSATPAGAAFTPIGPIAVRPLVAPLTVTTTSLPVATVGVGYRAALTATGGAAAYLWRVSTPLPAGLAFSSSGVLSGTPKGAGVVTLLFSVTDAKNNQTVSAKMPFDTQQVAPQGRRLWGWGDNDAGQLAHQTVWVGGGTIPYADVPVTVGGMSDVTQVVAGSDIYDKDAGYVLRSDGRVWAWGDNSFGQLGNGTTTNSTVPVQIPSLVGVTAIAAGRSFALALTSDGSVWAWGRNDFGQLGNGTMVNSPVPVKVIGLGPVATIAAGYQTGYASGQDGTVDTWGTYPLEWKPDSEYVPANSTSVPVPVARLTGVARISCGGMFALALKNDGTVWTWGDNQRSELGRGYMGGGSSEPQPVFGLTGVTAVSGGVDTGYALRSDGTVWTWGDNSAGQVGDGTTFERDTPVPVPGLTGITAVAGSAYNGYALSSSGTVWSWGAGQIGQLGNSTMADMSTLPVPVSGLSGVVGIGTGSQSSTAYAVVG